MKYLFVRGDNRAWYQTRNTKPLFMKKGYNNCEDSCRWIFKISVWAIYFSKYVRYFRFDMYLIHLNNDFAFLRSKGRSSQSNICGGIILKTKEDYSLSNVKPVVEIDSLSLEDIYS